MSDTQNNIIRFNYLVDPTTLMSNSWITTNTDTTQNTMTGVGGQAVTHYWRTITFDFTGKTPFSGVFRIEVAGDKGTPIQPYNFESISGDNVSGVSYENDELLFEGDGAGILLNFSDATENTTYTETEIAGTWSYTASTTTETDYDHYEVELYVNSDVTTFPNNLFYADSNITSVEFDTYSITSIEDGDKNTGAFFDCDNLKIIILPDNIEYIGDYAFSAISLKYMNITLFSSIPPVITNFTFENITLNLSVHETSLQSYINSDWADYVTSIDTIETPTYNNVLKFNYSEDPTEMLKNLWVNSCTDTSANTVVGVGEHTEPGYMPLVELQDLTKNWTQEQVTESKNKSKAIADAGGLSKYLISNGWTSEEVNEFMSIYDENSRNAYVICYIETNSEDYDDIMSFIETEVTVYDHYEVTLYINSAVNTFETTMFADDENITSVEFDYNVTSIIDDAFNGCENLSSVTLTSTVPPTIGEDTFSLISPDAVLYVPNASIPAYQTAGFGDYFGEIRGTSPEPPTPFRGYGFNRTNMIDIDYLNEIGIRFNR